MGNGADHGVGAGAQGFGDGAMAAPTVLDDGWERWMFVPFDAGGERGSWNWKGFDSLLSDQMPLPSPI